jgi:hypothetical protein
VTTPLIQEITSVDELRAANRRLGIASMVGRVPHYRFAIAGLSDATNRDATERMSNYQHECGCFAGGLLMGASVLGFLIMFIVSGRSPVGGGLQGVGLFLALLAGSTLAGKMLGLLRARIRMVLLIRHMAARADRDTPVVPA